MSISTSPKEMKLGHASGWAMVAERVDEYAPVPGDVICFSRERRPLIAEKAALRDEGPPGLPASLGEPSVMMELARKEQV